MAKITVNGVELEISDNCDVSIDGNKISITARGNYGWVYQSPYVVTTGGWTVTGSLTSGSVS